MALRPVTAIEAFYKGLQVFTEKLGEFLREAAVLVLIFIPLDLWKDQLTPTRIYVVVSVSAAVFFAGFGCECSAIVVKRVRDRYEEEMGYESRRGS